MPPRKTKPKPPPPRKSAVVQPDFPGIARSLDLTPHKTIRLAVSGDVALNRLETRIIDTPDFQRLRRIRQLGPAFWIYPTALHTRFDHSLGTLGMAVRMIEAIRANRQRPDAQRLVSPEDEQLARLFALLHDVTHIPFGHTIEDECAVFPRHDNDEARILRFVGEESPIGAILLAGLGPVLYARFLKLFGGERAPGLGDDRYIVDLVAGAISADLLDYLRRDAFFCNIAIDSDYRFLQSLSIVPHEGRRRLVVQLWKEGAAHPRRDVLNELIRLLDNRYLLGERVYFHHAKLVAGAMIAGAAARSVRAGELALDDLYGMGDDVLLWSLGRSADPAVRRLAAGLNARALWKTAFVHPFKAVQAARKERKRSDLFEDLMRRFHNDAFARIDAEDRLAAKLGFDPADILLYCPHYKMAMKSADTLVFWDGAIRPLKECGDDALIGARLQAILDSHEHLWAFRAFVRPDRDAAAVPAACSALLAL